MKLGKEPNFAEVVLRLVYRNILPRLLNQQVASQLGFARPSYETGITRSHQFMVQLSAELGENWDRLVQTNAENTESDWRKVERRHVEEAALDLVEVVRSLPQPVREVVERRAVGMSWKAISADLPKRVYFSLTDDWETALRILNERHFQLLERFR